MKILKNILLLAIVLSSSILFAQELPAPMDPPRLVNDFAGLLNQDEVARLETKLRAYNDTTSTQIYIVIVNDLLGYDKSDYAPRLAEKWKIGQKGKNNGLLILVKPNTASEKGEAFIATGYGLEEVIPDITANQILKRELFPNFKQKQYYQGFDAATTTIINLLAGKFTANQYNKKSSGSGIFIIIVIGIILFLTLFGGNKRNGGKTIGSNLPFWLALGMFSGGSNSGGFGGFSSGSGGFGGGGFGGGGGGSFGGGGAGGSW
jgi:uncharacterized protein